MPMRVRLKRYCCIISVQVGFGGGEWDATSYFNFIGARGHTRAFSGAS